MTTKSNPGYLEYAPFHARHKDLGEEEFVSRWPQLFLVSAPFDEKTPLPSNAALYPLRQDEVYTFGRKLSADVNCVIPTVEASRKHARVSYDPTERSWFVQDLGSTNGTFVDEKRLGKGMRAPLRLEKGPVLRIGEIKLRMWTSDDLYAVLVLGKPRPPQERSKKSPVSGDGFDRPAGKQTAPPRQASPAGRKVAPAGRKVAPPGAESPPPPPRRGTARPPAPPSARRSAPPSRSPQGRPASGAGSPRPPAQDGPPPPPRRTSQPQTPPKAPPPSGRISRTQRLKRFRQAAKKVEIPTSEAPATPKKSAPIRKQQEAPKQKLYAELPAELESEPVEPGNAELFNALLIDARARDASDLHLLANAAPLYRINGALSRDGNPIPPEVMDENLRGMLTPQQYRRFCYSGDLDLCYAFEAGGRFRTNVHKSQKGDAISFRLIEAEIPAPDVLGLPEATKELTTFAQGLVLCTGPMGAGKTTTLMSLAQLVNEDRNDHIITVEDPVELLMEPAKCHISQRELGSHTVSFQAALKAALREDPDIIVIGDLRDYSTASIAISAAETGHLVLASMHARGAANSIDKLIDMFPAGEQETIRQMVSESLRGVVYQVLVPGKEGERFAACALLINSIAVANQIREGKTGNLHNLMELGQATGMVTLDQSLKKFVQDGVVDLEVALEFAENRERFRV